MTPHLKDQSEAGLLDYIQSAGEKPFRLRQIMLWLYRKRVDRYEQMENVSRRFLERLSAAFRLRKLTTAAVDHSRDGAVKFAFRLEDDHVIESVMIPDGRRMTACLSTQVGCGLGCVFCATARRGFVRHLTIGEITGQVIAVNDFLAPLGRNLTHLVFMGMGEPLLNYKNVMAALEYITSDVGMIISPRKITLSTAGVVPGIRKLAHSGVPVGLAVSLNSALEPERLRLMPVTGRYSLEQVVRAARDFYRETGEKITYEYLMIPGVTMSLKQIAALREIVRGDYCKVNFIAFNPIGPRSSFRAPSHQEVQAFLLDARRLPVVVTVRKSRGADIRAACGMLSGTLHPAIDPPGTQEGR